jgi:sulfide:quinone oxidoreductase
MAMGARLPTVEGCSAETVRCDESGDGTETAMNEVPGELRHDDPGNRPTVLIAGGGVAGLEAAFALRELAGGRVSVTILAPSDEFVYRPMAIGEPFTSGHARHFSLAKLAEAAHAQLVRGALAEVDPAGRTARTDRGAVLEYDAMLVCPGATMHHPHEHATRFDDSQLDELLHGLVQDVEEGYVQRLAIIVPTPMPWPFPAYELALMASERAYDMNTEMDITVLTPETAPLAVFGDEASRALSRLLADRRIDVVTSAACEVPTAQSIVVHPGGRTLEADRIVSLPALSGPAIPGLPHDENGFIPIDEYGRVRGVDSVWAAGDATDYPLKQGGVAAQLADTVAESIAKGAGVAVEPKPFAPALVGVLLTGGTPRYLRRGSDRAGAETSALTEVPHGAHPPKIAARYLTPELEG